MNDEQSAAIAAALARIADSLEALSPAHRPIGPVLTDADAYHWDAAASHLMPVNKVSRVPLALLRGIDDVRDILLDNTLLKRSELSPKLFRPRRRGCLW